MQPASKLPELLECLVELAASGVELSRRLPVALDAGGHDPEAEGERYKSLLGTVVEVALETPAGRVGRLDDAGPGSGQLLDLCAQGRREALVLECQRRSGGHGSHELALVVAGGVVD